MIDRRKFLHDVLSLFAGPAIVRAGVIMPIKPVLWTSPPLYFGEIDLAAGRNIDYWLDQAAQLTGLPRHLLLAQQCSLSKPAAVTIFSPAASSARH